MSADTLQAGFYIILIVIAVAVGIFLDKTHGLFFFGCTNLFLWANATISTTMEKMMKRTVRRTKKYFKMLAIIAATLSFVLFNYYSNI